MGLGTTHGCWSGPYSSFGEWRWAVASAAGINLRVMQGYGGKTAWDTADPLTGLLYHSDCEGSLAVPLLTPLAARLEELLPKIVTSPTDFDDQRAKTMQFIRGLRLAASLGEPVEFH